MMCVSTRHTCALGSPAAAVGCDLMAGIPRSIFCPSNSVLNLKSYCPKVLVPYCSGPFLS